MGKAPGPYVAVLEPTTEADVALRIDAALRIVGAKKTPTLAASDLLPMTRGSLWFATPSP